MDLELEKKLEDQIKALPKELRHFLAEGIWITSVRNLGGRTSLSPEQITNLENEVLFVIVGMELKSDLKKNIEVNLGVNPQVALTLGEEIEKQILKSVAHLLPTEVESLEIEAPHDMLIPANLPTGSALEQKLAPLTKTTDQTSEDKKWEERKKVLGESAVIADYKGNDPYREPLK